MTVDPRSFAIRFSHLKRMAQSPAHYLQSLSSVYDAEDLRKGRALHSYMLGGSDVVIYDQGVRRGGKWDLFVAAHPGATILIPSEARDVTGMRASLERNDRAMELLDGIREREMVWKIGDRICSGTPDVLKPHSVVELKSTRCSEPGRFVRDAAWRGYHAQLSWYQDGARLSNVAHPTGGYIVAVESSAPYPVTIFELTPTALEVGRKLCRLWWERLMTCEQSDSWPAYCESDVPFDVADGEATIVVDGEEMSLAEIGL